MNRSCFYFPHYQRLAKVLLESQAAGLPIISTNVGDCSDVVGQSGLIVEPKNPYEIARATKELILDEQLYSEMQFNCLKNAQLYSWEAVVSKLDKLYETLLNER